MVCNTFDNVFHANLDVVKQKKEGLKFDISQSVLVGWYSLLSNHCALLAQAIPPPREWDFWPFCTQQEAFCDEMAPVCFVDKQR